MADALRVNPSVTECNLCGNKLGAEGWTTLFTALSKSSVSKITKWDLSSQNGIKESVNSLAEYISVSASLTECKLRGNQLCKEGWTAIFTALRDSKVSKISTWDLQSEAGIYQTVKVLAEYISVSASLTQVCQIRQVMRCGAE